MQTLGPWQTIIDVPLYVSIYGDDDIKKIGFEIPDSADSFLAEIGAIDKPDITVSSPRVMIDWSIDIREHGRGFVISDPYIKNVTAEIEYEITVEDPITGEFVVYEHTFTPNLKNFQTVVEAKMMPGSTLLPEDVEIWLDRELINVNFGH